MGIQLTNGLPVCPSGHEHIGMWLTTLQIALLPHVPGHGSLHLFLTQALFFGQSELETHSGLHPVYGSPWYSDKQLQMPLLHTAFDPQGFG